MVITNVIIISSYMYVSNVHDIRHLVYSPLTDGEDKDGSQSTGAIIGEAIGAIVARTYCIQC